MPSAHSPGEGDGASHGQGRGRIGPGSRRRFRIRSPRPHGLQAGAHPVADRLRGRLLPRRLGQPRRLRLDEPARGRPRDGRLHHRLRLRARHLRGPRSLRLDLASLGHVDHLSLEGNPGRIRGHLDGNLPGCRRGGEPRTRPSRHAALLFRGVARPELEARHHLRSELDRRHPGGGGGGAHLPWRPLQLSAVRHDPVARGQGYADVLPARRAPRHCLFQYGIPGVLGGNPRGARVDRPSQWPDASRWPLAGKLAHGRFQGSPHGAHGLGALHRPHDRLPAGGTEAPPTHRVIARERLASPSDRVTLPAGPWHNACSSLCYGGDGMTARKRRRRLMWRAISGTIVITAMLALGVWATSAQSQQMPGPGSPSNAWTIGLVEGTVKSVDPATGTVQISTGLLGLFGKTLRLSEDTEVQIDGRLGSLTEIREGARVKVAYEVRDGKNVATHIELTPRVCPRRQPKQLLRNNSAR